MDGWSRHSVTSSSEERKRRKKKKDKKSEGKGANPIAAKPSAMAVVMYYVVVQCHDTEPHRFLLLAGWHRHTDTQRRPETQPHRQARARVHHTLCFCAFD